MRCRKKLAELGWDESNTRYSVAGPTRPGGEADLFGEATT